MAKSFIDQLLNLAGIKLPDAQGHYSPSVYREEQSPHKESSQAGKYQPKNSAGTAQATAGMTGVAKYLAKKQQEEQEKAKAEAAALADMTGVARYLAKLEGKVITSPGKTETAEHENTANLTSVEKYLAKQQTVAGTPQPKAAQPVAKAKAAEQKPEVEEKKAQPKQATEKHSPPAAKTPGKTINLAEDASQCQAATSKGTQCRRKTGLSTLEKTINHQKYKFAVCGQHNNKEFTPFAELLQKG